MAYYAVSEMGPKRFDNEYSDLDKTRMEDSILADPEKRIFIVADGLSGMRRVRGLGKQASQTAVNSVYEVLKNYKAVDKRILRMAVNQANSAVVKQTEGYGGTTLEVVVARDAYAYYAHLGDSRIYHATKNMANFKEKLVRQVTTDDHDGHEQTNFIGLLNPEIHLGKIFLKDKDLLGLFTDGIHGFIDQNRLRKMLASNYDPEFIAKQIRKSTEEEMTAWDRKTDNFSIIVYRHEIPRDQKKREKPEEKVLAQ